WHRFIYAQSITDEIFAVSIHRTRPLSIWYSLAAILPADLGWSAGTALGLSMGNILPERLVMALGVALFGLFLGIIMPPARENRVVLGVIAVSFALSLLFAKVPPMSHMTSGNRIILLTILIASAAAALFPVKDEEPEKEDAHE
ncbi:MAG: branched-chain amino acid ABC transporter permease, partial [Clostridia bacterium]|nr:branched-chain amino acid ABC transporter permease [Clostridia bacterium]